MNGQCSYICRWRAGFWIVSILLYGELIRLTHEVDISVVDYLILCTLRLTLKHKKTRCI